MFCCFLTLCCCLLAVAYEFFNSANLTSFQWQEGGAPTPILWFNAWHLLFYNLNPLPRAFGYLSLWSITAVTSFQDRHRARYLEFSYASFSCRVSVTVLQLSDTGFQLTKARGSTVLRATVIRVRPGFSHQRDEGLPCYSYQSTGFQLSEGRDSIVLQLSAGFQLSEGRESVIVGIRNKRQSCGSLWLLYYAPTWWAIFRLAASIAVDDVKLPMAVRPTLRMSNTSFKNLSGINPVQSLLLFLDRAGSIVVASPVGMDHVFKKIASWTLRNFSSYVALACFVREGVIIVV